MDVNVLAVFLVEDHPGHSFVEPRVRAGLQGIYPLWAPDSAPLRVRWILSHNLGRKTGLADGIVVTPSHNPPEDGGFKYNPPHGGPAGTGETRWIERRANELLADGNRAVKRLPFAQALALLAIVAILYVRPQGLLGRPAEVI